MAQEEKLEEAKRLYETANADQRYVLESLFPELKESEDERIRKALMQNLKERFGTKGNMGEGLDMPDVLTWLEKQGKHTNFLSKIQVGDKVTRNEDGELVNLSQLARVAKPDDKVEPKFHEGDIIIHKELGGDYIHTPHKIIQVDILDKKYRLEGGLVAHFGEQEDYELVEQKPWSEEDGLQLQAAIDICKYSGCTITSDWLTSLKDRVQPQLKQEWKQENMDDLTDFENTMMHIGDSFFGQHAGLDQNDTNAIKEQANLLLGLVPKQEWSEEDEYLLDETIKHLEALIRITKKQGSAYSDEIQYFQRDIDWLKSLSHKSQWKPSDEQMKVLLSEVKAWTKGCPKQIVLESLYNDLKKLREQ